MRPLVSARFEAEARVEALLHIPPAGYVTAALGPIKLRRG